ncbi:early meiotic induction protein 1 [Colletotrichum spaethianum]|uniref:Early meiotic induction protein 1 n=1 Tax=Colletotrichum spaethianum TaxID=700344 RepID=A0AA37LJ90_9PEZI|nr:early meiotic induction protein 1 [Colletotrichum spaethianum]GKT47020.1 early meiotic induction protein 1 [Colletotrichum spaethianum]
MGWLWASPSPPKSPAPGQASQAPASTPPPATKPTEPEMDPEIAKFIALFQNDSGNKPEEPVPAPAQSSTTPSKSTPSPSSSWFSLKSSPNMPSQTNNRTITPPSDNPVAEATLPTEMSCRQAFDMAFHCQSVGGQWNHIYRYGTMRSCSEHWEDFWFCMRIKGYSGKMKEDVIRDHYRQKEYEKYGNGKPSSEDVWQARTAKVPPGTVFTEKFEEPTVDDEEWQRMEIERRRQIREGLGISSATA